MDTIKAPIDVTLDKNYDSAFCGSIPLHLVNLIQPHGVLLTLSRQDLVIIQVSENAADVLGTTVEALLDQPLAQYLDDALFLDLKAKINSDNGQEKIPFSVTLYINGAPLHFIAQVHARDQLVLVELEKSEPATANQNFLAHYQQIKYVTTLLKQAENAQDLAQIAVAEIKKLSGFDRVLAYQFDPHWNGIVIGEAKEPDMESFLGLRFPASDVPKQARELYFKNPYRLIPNRDYTPVRLLPVINPVTNQFTDLSDCSLRSVAGVHLEYLGNMGVLASMSLPLIIDNQLWGLISCHHRNPLNPTYEMRSALELLSGIISAQLAGKEREKAILFKSQLRHVYAQLLEQLHGKPHFMEGLFVKGKGMEELLNLSGAAVVFEGGLLTSGQTPSAQEIKELVFWLRRNKTDKTYCTDTLPSNYLRAKDFKQVASGLIALPINPEHGEFILGFRPEVLQTVNWGGNPNQAVQMEPDGKNYHPRNSFAQYQETVKNTSLPWLAEELETAEALRSAVLEKIIKDRY
ncbi:GAF domain-containing protein [Rufibacter sp. LB8]|uniref:GAF domain-containing protein n=1 Tax=Rufibacter sp. LB8 TaxID=2777781 RepID=UPI00178C1C69|nr:GAF domain-containing protein [Rufibacter sp. LB8]